MRPINSHGSCGEAFLDTAPRKTWAGRRKRRDNGRQPCRSIKCKTRCERWSGSILGATTCRYTSGPRRRRCSGTGRTYPAAVGRRRDRSYRMVLPAGAWESPAQQVVTGRADAALQNILRSLLRHVLMSGAVRTVIAQAPSSLTLRVSPAPSCRDSAPRLPCVQHRACWHAPQP